jgi:protein TonB
VSAPVATTPPPPKAIPTDYAARIFQRISTAAANSYPRAAVLKGLEGSVSYQVTMDASGALKDFKVEPSGIESFDKAAGDAIQKSSPFPMPPDLGASSYKLSGIITYRLTE